MASIHPTAIVDSSADIASSAEIGPYCVIGPSVTIGEGTKLRNHVTIPSHTRIGRDVLIHPYAIVGGDPQDKKFRGEVTWCEVGDGTQIREQATIHRGTENGGGMTRVGRGCLIMVAAHIAHDCTIGDQAVIANQVMLAGHVHVEDAANIGGGTGVHHFATIGACAMVGGLARISRDVPPYMIVEGNPAKVRGHNHVAMSRRGYSETHIEAVKEAYKRLFRENGAPMAEKLAELRQEFSEVPAIHHLCDALIASALGVHGRAREVQRQDNKRARQVKIDSPAIRSAAV